MSLVHVAKKSKPNLEVEAPRCCRIKLIKQARGADENSFKLFHPREQFVGLGDLPMLSRFAAIGQDTIGFVQKKDDAFLFRLVEHGRDIPFGGAHPLIQEIRRAFHQKRFSQSFGQVPAKRRFACSWRAVETKTGRAIHR